MNSLKFCHLGINSNGVNEPWFRGLRPLIGAWRLLVFTRRAPRSYGAVALQALCGSWDGGQHPEIYRRGGPIASLRTRAGARSLRLPQRVISGFVQALDFVAAEALIPDLKPCAKGFGYA